MSILGLLLAFSNCGLQKPAVLESELAGQSLGESQIPQSENVCEETLLNVFASGYHSFLKTNCSTCHAAGPGRGQFANADINVAFKDFQQIGYSKISTNATSVTHNAPYSGPQHIQTVNELRIDWLRAEENSAACNTNGEQPPASAQPSYQPLFELASLPIPTMEFGQEREVSWVLNRDLLALSTESPVPNAPDAVFSVKVSRQVTTGGDEYYSVRQPLIHSSRVDLNVQGLMIKINGFRLDKATTFKYINADVRALSPNDVSSVFASGAIVIPGKTFSTDQISFQFQNLKTITLPPPTPPVTVQLSGATYLKKSSSSSEMAVEVVLSSPAADPVSVTLAADSSNICNSATPSLSSTCHSALLTLACANPTACTNQELALRRARNIAGESGNRFDWDYQFPSSTLVFLPGETRKTVQVRFSKDIRREENRLLTLKLEMGLGKATLGTLKEKHILIEKIRNPIPTPGVARFQDLMRPGTGILAVNCMKCHDSIKKEGQLDLTNYDEMIARGVLIPGSSASRMFRRINPLDPNWANLQPMPRTGPMEDAYIRAVQAWIEAGAPNN